MEAVQRGLGSKANFATPAQVLPPGGVSGKHLGLVELVLVQSEAIVIEL